MEVVPPALRTHCLVPIAPAMSQALHSEGASVCFCQIGIVNVYSTRRFLCLPLSLNFMMVTQIV